MYQVVDTVKYLTVSIRYTSVTDKYRQNFCSIHRAFVTASRDNCCFTFIQGGTKTGPMGHPIVKDRTACHTVNYF